MNDPTDQQLLRDYAERQSEAAFAALVQRYVDLVYSAAFRMVCDAHAANDVTQSVFVALAQNANHLTDRPTLAGWLHGTARNLAAKAVRTEVRRRAREQEATVMNELLSAHPDTDWEHIAPYLDDALNRTRSKNSSRLTQSTPVPGGKDATLYVGHGCPTLRFAPLLRWDAFSTLPLDMPIENDTPSADSVPLAVDLDGTLIRTDMMWESLKLLLRRNPLALINILIWWAQGRAFLKEQLAARVHVDPATLPYHEEFLTWLKDEKRAGRKLILATASDRQMAEPVFRHVGIFDELMASDGKINLRGDNKRRALSARFGEHGYDYAGNSSVDLGVWPGTRAAIVVNARPGLEKRAALVTKVARVFP